MSYWPPNCAPSISAEKAAPGATIHIVLEATDAGSPPLTRYRRVVVTVTEGS